MATIFSHELAEEQVFLSVKEIQIKINKRTLGQVVTPPTYNMIK